MWPNQETSEDASAETSERPQSSRLQEASQEVAARQKNNDFVYRVDLLSGNDVYDTRFARDRVDATALALDVIQATASEWNVLRPKGMEKVRPERTQYAGTDGSEFDGQIIVEWSLFLPGMDQSSARVTVVTSETQEMDQIDRGEYILIF